MGGIWAPPGHVVWILFGPGTWGSGGNMVAWAICGTLGFGWLHAKQKARHIQLMAQAARHHQETMAQAQQHHEALKQHMSTHCADVKEHMSATTAQMTAAVAVPQQLLDGIKSRPPAAARPGSREDFEQRLREFMHNHPAELDEILEELGRGPAARKPAARKPPGGGRA